MKFNLSEGRSRIKGVLSSASFSRNKVTMVPYPSTGSTGRIDWHMCAQISPVRRVRGDFVASLDSFWFFVVLRYAEHSEIRRFGVDL